MRVLRLKKRDCRVLLNRMPGSNDGPRDVLKHTTITKLFKDWIDPYDEDIEAIVERIKDVNIRAPGPDGNEERADLSREIDALEHGADGQTEVEVELEESEFGWIKNRWFASKGMGTTDRETAAIFNTITETLDHAPSFKARRGERQLSVVEPAEESEAEEASA